MRVHQVKRSANTQVTDADQNNSTGACANRTITLEIQPLDCQNYIWYDQEVGGNIVSTGTSFTIPATLPPGTYDFYIQPIRFGCPTYDRGKATVVVGQTTAVVPVVFAGNQV